MTTYSKQFYYEFNAGVRTQTDSVMPRWRISFNRANYTGDAIELLASGTPFKVATVDNSSGPAARFQSIISLSFTFEFACQDYWQWESFYVNTDRELQFVVELDDVDGSGDHYRIEYVGWIVPTDTKAEHGPKPYKVTITGTDGISTLKTRILVDANSKRLSGLVNLSTAIRTALNLTGFTRNFISGINLYEAADTLTANLSPSGKINISSDPLNHAYVQAQTFTDDSGNAALSLDTLKRILEPFGARLSMTHGAWYAIQANAAAGGWDPYNLTGDTIPLRVYSNSDPTATPNAEYLTPSLVSTVGKDELLKIGTGGVDTLPVLLKGVKVEESYGRSVSLLPNADLANLDNTYLPVGWGRNLLANDKAFVTGSGTELDPAVLNIFGGGQQLDEYVYDWRTGYVYTSFEVSQALYKKTLQLTLKAQFKLQTLRSSKIGVWAYRFDGVYWLGRSGQWIKGPKGSDLQGYITENYTTISGQMVSKPGWTDLEIKMPALDRVSQYKFEFTCGEALDKTDSNGHYIGPNTGPPEPLVQYKNISLQVTDGSLNIAGTTATIVDKYIQPETLASLSFDYVPATAQPTTKVNALLRADGSASGFFFHPKDTFGVPGYATAGKPLINWLVEALARQTMRPAPTFDGVIYGHFPYGVHTVLKLMDWGTLDSSGAVVTPYLMQITHWEYDARMMANKVTAVAIMTDDLPVTPPEIPYWKDQDGNEIPMNFDDSNQPVYPADKNTTSPALSALIEAIIKGLAPPITGKIRPKITGLVPNTNPNVTGRLLIKDAVTGTTLASVPGRLRFDPSILKIP